MGGQTKPARAVECEVVQLRPQLRALPPPRIVIHPDYIGDEAIVLGGVAFIADQGSKESNEALGLHLLSL